MLGIFTQDDNHATDLMITGNTPEEAILNKPTDNEYISAETDTNDPALKEEQKMAIASNLLPRIILQRLM